MSVEKLDDFSPLPGLLPPGRFVVSGVRTETAHARALIKEFAYMMDEPETSEPAQKVETLEVHASQR